jgi:hypothetical protein
LRALLRLGGRRDDGLRQLLVVAQALLEVVPVHLALAALVHLQDRGRRGAGEIVAHHDLDRHHRQALAHQHVRIGIFDDVVGAEVARGLEPEARGLGEHLPFERNHRKVAVERADAVGGDEDTRAVGKIVVLAHLAAVVAGKLANHRFGQRVLRVRGKR